MSKDIREIMKNYKNEEVSLSANHRNKFQDRLMKEVQTQQPKKRNYRWLQVAASVVLIVSLAINFYPKGDVVEPIKDTPKQAITLGNLSPELKSIESYYVNSINYEISNLDVTEDNKEILDGYLAKISELTTEYKSLTTELNTKGVNDEIINALINNLQLRLKLLQRLKKQLNELKNLNSKQHETQKL